MILFVRHDHLEGRARLTEEHALVEGNQLAMVHPRLYLEKVRRRGPGSILQVALAATKNAMKDRVIYCLNRIGVKSGGNRSINVVATVT